MKIKVWMCMSLHKVSCIYDIHVKVMVNYVCLIHVAIKNVLMLDP